MIVKAIVLWPFLKACSFLGLFPRRMSRLIPMQALVVEAHLKSLPGTRERCGHGAIHAGDSGGALLRSLPKGRKEGTQYIGIYCISFFIRLIRNKECWEDTRRLWKWYCKARLVAAIDLNRIADCWTIDWPP